MKIDKWRAKMREFYSNVTRDELIKHLNKLVLKL
jgi:hypothetical protein